LLQAEDFIAWVDGVNWSLQHGLRGLKALERPRGFTAGNLGSRSAVENSRYELLTASLDVRPRWEQLAGILGALPKNNRCGEYLALHCWFADPAAFKPEVGALRLLLGEASKETADPEQWLFLDIETTGVSGGSGTYPFLIGLAWWEGGGLEIEQLFMRDYADEPAVLHALGERLAERKVLVTFNGKSFDWPLIETRYRMCRQAPLPGLRAHLDFLHSARSLWRLRLGSVRLSELERRVLGRVRTGDIFSGLIPRIYLDFMRGGCPEKLIPVFTHNQMDLRGLAALSARILSLLADPEVEGQDALELFGVSRMCERRGETLRARALYEKSLTGSLPLATSRAARSSLARLAKRDRDFPQACELWRSMLGNSPHGYEAYEQLAIYYEHHTGDLQTALATVEDALAELRLATTSGTISPGAYLETKRRFEHRLHRLARKSRRTCSDVPYLL
jgi:uncharacterized protein